jgi:hypothetical protein
LGEIMHQDYMFQGTKEMSLTTTALSTGLYIITVESTGIRTSRKIEIVK